MEYYDIFRQTFQPGQILPSFTLGAPFSQAPVEHGLDIVLSAHTVLLPRHSVFWRPSGIAEAAVLAFSNNVTNISQATTCG